MSELELIQQSIPKKEAYAFFVIAFGKKFGLAMDDEHLSESNIKLFCKKAEECLMAELKEYSKTN